VKKRGEIIEDANNISHFGVSGMLSSKLARSTHETSCLNFLNWFINYVIFSFTVVIFLVILLVFLGNGSFGYSHCVYLVRVNNPIGMFFICPILAKNAHEIAPAFNE
jgi:hypothetical protein